MGTTIQHVTQCSVPGHEQRNTTHPHLPYWYEVNVKSFPTPVEVFTNLALQVGMFWLNAFAPKQPSPETVLRDAMLRSADFTARRIGLKPGLNFMATAADDTSLRFAFGSLAGLMRFTHARHRVDNSAPMSEQSVAREAPELPVVQTGVVDGHAAKAANNVHFFAKRRKNHGHAGWKPQLVS